MNLKEKTWLSRLTTTPKIENMVYFYLQNRHCKLQNQCPKSKFIVVKFCSLK